MATMIYKYPATMKMPLKLAGKAIDYQVVNDGKAKELIAKGWYDNPQEAIESFDANKQADTNKNGYTDKKELQGYAESLGIKVDKRWSKSKLEEVIAEKVNEDGL